MHKTDQFYGISETNYFFGYFPHFLSLAKFHMKARPNLCLYPENANILLTLFNLEDIVNIIRHVESLWNISGSFLRFYFI